MRYGASAGHVSHVAATNDIELTFDSSDGPAVAAFDHVVLTLPFTALRDVDLAASLALPQWKRDAINLLGYGTNAKMMVGFDGPYWRALGASGASYSDLPHHQTTWETQSDRRDGPRDARADGLLERRRGASLNPLNVAGEANAVPRRPGARAARRVDTRGARRRGGARPSGALAVEPADQGLLHLLQARASSPRLPAVKAHAVANLHFAGEHANSFYEYQGFMEGACVSGLDAANEILRDLKKA